jgi:hypothetical protein
MLPALPCFTGLGPGDALRLRKAFYNDRWFWREDLSKIWKKWRRIVGAWDVLTGRARADAPKKPCNWPTALPGRRVELGTLLLPGENSAIISNMLDIPRLNLPISLPEDPVFGTITPSSSGTAAVVPIEWLQQINASGVRPGELEQLLEALNRSQEIEDAIAVLDEDDTGIENTLWFIPAAGAQHGPRIKVAIDPKRAVSPGGKIAAVPFDAATKPEIAAALERQVREFIELNREALLQYWNPQIPSTKKFLAMLKPIRR